MINIPKPVFRDDNRIDISTIEQKIKTLVDEKVNNELSQRKAIEDERTRDQNIQQKLKMLKEKIAIAPEPKVLPIPHTHEHEKEITDCPSCKGHKLKIEGSSAKCTGDQCGKEYLLLEKVNDVKSKINRKDYLCIGCGHTLSKKEVETDKVPVCPLCNTNSGVTKIRWDNIQKQKQ